MATAPSTGTNVPASPTVESDVEAVPLTPTAAAAVSDEDRLLERLVDRLTRMGMSPNIQLLQPTVTSARAMASAPSSPSWEEAREVPQEQQAGREWDAHYPPWNDQGHWDNHGRQWDQWLSGMSSDWSSWQKWNAGGWKPEEGKMTDHIFHIWNSRSLTDDGKNIPTISMP